MAQSSAASEADRTPAAAGFLPAGRSATVPADSIKAIVDTSWMNSGVDVPDQETRPREGALLQNFPKCFNPATTISIFIPAASQGIVKMLDLLGREVTTIVSEQLPTGLHTRLWHAAQ